MTDRSTQPTGGTLRFVAHELRAHLSVLNGYADLLRDPTWRASPARLELAVDAMRQHLASLLAMASRLGVAVRDGGGLTHQPAPVRIGDVAREAAALADEVATEHRCRIAVDLGRVEDLVVEADSFHLVTAVRNLLENACRHGPSGGLVCVEGRIHDGQVALQVWDEGPGIAHLGRSAFDPLIRGPEGEEAHRGGLGLGLSLVDAVAGEHGGGVYWGRTDEGSCVGLEFPAQRPRPPRRAVASG